MTGTVCAIRTYCGTIRLQNLWHNVNDQAQDLGIHADLALLSPCSGQSTAKTRLELENLPKGLNRVNAAGTTHTRTVH